MTLYLTQQDKDELESKISDLEKQMKDEALTNYAFQTYGKILVYNEILSQSIILPVEPDWSKTFVKSLTEGNDVRDLYPDGVIIKKI